MLHLFLLSPKVGLTFGKSCWTHRGEVSWMAWWHVFEIKHGYHPKFDLNLWMLLLWIGWENCPHIQGYLDFMDDIFVDMCFFFTLDCLLSSIIFTRDISWMGSWGYKHTYRWGKHLYIIKQYLPKFSKWFKAWPNERFPHDSRRGSPIPKISLRIVRQQNIAATSLWWTGNKQTKTRLNSTIMIAKSALFELERNLPKMRDVCLWRFENPSNSGTTNGNPL